MSITTTVTRKSRRLKFWIFPYGKKPVTGTTTKKICSRPNPKIGFMVLSQWIVLVMSRYSIQACTLIVNCPSVTENSASAIVMNLQVPCMAWCGFVALPRMTGIFSVPKTSCKMNVRILRLCCKKFIVILALPMSFTRLPPALKNALAMTLCGTRPKRHWWKACVVLAASLKSLPGKALFMVPKLNTPWRMPLAAIGSVVRFRWTFPCRYAWAPNMSMLPISVVHLWWCTGPFWVHWNALSAC